MLKCRFSKIWHMAACILKHCTLIEKLISNNNVTRFINGYTCSIKIGSNLSIMLKTWSNIVVDIQWFLNKLGLIKRISVFSVLRSRSFIHIHWHCTCSLEHCILSKMVARPIAGERGFAAYLMPLMKMKWKGRRAYKCIQ